jgi:hypothetical protein
VLPVRDVYLEHPGIEGGGPFLRPGRFGDQGEVGNEFAPAPKIPGEGNVDAPERRNREPLRKVGIPIDQAGEIT